MKWPKYATVRLNSWADLDDLIARHGDSVTIPYLPRSLVEVLLNPPPFPVTIGEYPIVEGTLAPDSGA